MAVSSVIVSAARTTSGSSAAVSTPPARDVGAVLVDVTAASGTSPSLALTVEWSTDGSTWIKGDPADSFTAITAVGSAAKKVDVKGDFMRLVWAVTGTTPSFTFSADFWVTSD